MAEKPSLLPLSLFTPDGERLSLRAWLALVVICLAFFLPGFTSMPPADRDESFFAQSSKQMVETHNYMDIRFQNEARYKKPIGVYWLQAASANLFGSGHLDEIWVYRVPSLICGIIAVLMTAALGTLMFGPVIGFTAALMMAGCLILNVEVRQAKTDATLLACVMVAQYGMAKAYLKRTQDFATAFLFWTAVGVGVLVKGPIILLILLSTLLWLYMTEKNLRWAAGLKPWIGLPWALLLTLPWLVTIGIASHGQFYQQSAGHDMLHKIFNGEYRGIMPPGLHLLAFSLFFFPFSLFGYLAVPDAWKNRRDSAVRFCLGWIIPAWIVFEISLTKLPHYVMPMYPAIAILAAKALNAGFPALSGPRWRWLPPAVLGYWLMTGTALALGMVLIPYMMDHVWIGWQIKASFLLMAIQVGSLFLLFRPKADNAVFLAMGALLFFTCIFVKTLPSMQHLWVSRQIVEIAERGKPCEKLQIVSASYDEPSLVFMAGTRTWFVPSGAQAAFGLWVDPCQVAVVDTEHLKSFLGVFSGKSYKPVIIGSVEGLNIGSGREIAMTLYKLPKKPATAP